MIAARRITLLVSALLACAPALAFAQDAGRDLALAYDRAGGRILSGFLAKTGNVAISPYSIGSAMTLAMAGARGDTATELQRALGLGDAATNAGNYGRLIQSLDQIASAGNRPTVVKVANALAVTPAGADRVSQAFADALARDYRAELIANASVARVNEWVSGKTDGRIPALLDTIDPATIALLVNAITFDAKWSTRFDPGDTADLPFTLANGQKIAARTMSAHYPMQVVSGANYRALSLPYADGRVSFIAALPNPGVTPAAALAEIEKSDVAALLDRLTAAPTQRVNLALPKFDLRYKQDVTKPIAALGVHLAFDKDKADFGGMLKPDAAQAGPRISIGAIVHEAMIRTDEDGTIAAAATAVGMKAAAMPPPVQVDFIVDRPFLFFVVDRVTGAVLFEGRVEDPRG